MNQFRALALEAGYWSIIGHISVQATLYYHSSILS